LSKNNFSHKYGLSKVVILSKKIGKILEIDAQVIEVKTYSYSQTSVDVLAVLAVPAVYFRPILVSVTSMGYTEH
jgi:hypothetical protein